jgi:hypothetical protein
MKKVFTSLDNFISELIRKNINTVYQTRFIMSSPVLLGKGFISLINIYSLLTAEKDKELFEICLRLKSIYEMDLSEEEATKNKLYKDVEKEEKNIFLKLWKKHFKILPGAVKLDHEHLLVEELLWKKKLPVIRKNQIGKIFGIVQTKCPNCHNDIIFENQITKSCPYCDVEVTFDHENVRFVIETK